MEHDSVGYGPAPQGAHNASFGIKQTQPAPSNLGKRVRPEDGSFGISFDNNKIANDVAQNQDSVE